MLDRVRQLLSPPVRRTQQTSVMLDVGGQAVPLHIRRIARARRYRLRLAKDGSGLVLTMPPRVSVAAATGWAAGQQQWIIRQLAHAPQPLPVGPGSVLPFAGQSLSIRWDQAAPRQPVCVEGADGTLVLTVGGPQSGLGRRVAQWLQKEARGRIEAQACSLAGRIGCPVSRIRLADTRSRWGSCSSTGTLSFSWRLVLAPPMVLDYVVAHEVAHLRHLDHGPGFHALADQLYAGDTDEARRWLREHGRSLHRFQF